MVPVLLKVVLGEKSPLRGQSGVGDLHGPLLTLLAAGLLWFGIDAGCGGQGPAPESGRLSSCPPGMPASSECTR